MTYASEGREMQEFKTVQRLTNAAAQLCAAYDELGSAGYEGWSSEIKALIDIIDAEVEWLRRHGFTVGLTANP
jgi:hypothetical protein